MIGLSLFRRFGGSLYRILLLRIGQTSGLICNTLDHCIRNRDMKPIKCSYLSEYPGILGEGDYKYGALLSLRAGCRVPQYRVLNPISILYMHEGQTEFSGIRFRGYLSSDGNKRGNGMLYCM